MGALEGVCMELDDCAFPLLNDINATSDLDKGFSNSNWALLVGSVPRKAGMERGDLLGINGKIFTGQGQAINNNAASDVRVLVVGNPCNTNCLIAMNNAPDVPNERWHAMTRLDENRAKTQLAQKAGVHVSAVSNMTIWGNHSATQYPDFYNAKIDFIHPLAKSKNVYIKFSIQLFEFILITFRKLKSIICCTQKQKIYFTHTFLKLSIVVIYS